MLSKLKLKEFQNETNRLLANLEATLKQNKEKKRAIDEQIKKRTIHLFDLLFLNQVKLIAKNDQIEHDLILKSNELKKQQQNAINKLNRIEQRLVSSPIDSYSEEISNETETLNKTIDDIKQDLKSVQYNHCFRFSDTTISIGQLLVICFYILPY